MIAPNDETREDGGAAIEKTVGMWLDEEIDSIDESVDEVRKMVGEVKQVADRAAGKIEGISRRLDAQYDGSVFASLHGVVGDGVADDTAAMQSALDAVFREQRGATLRLPPGVIRITNTLRIGPSYSGKIVGAGSGKPPLAARTITDYLTTHRFGGTVIVWDTLAQAPMVKCTGTQGLVVEDVALLGRNKVAGRDTWAAAGILVLNAPAVVAGNCSFHRVYVLDAEVGWDFSDAGGNGSNDLPVLTDCGAIFCTIGLSASGSQTVGVQTYRMYLADTETGYRFSRGAGVLSAYGTVVRQVRTLLRVHGCGEQTEAMQFFGIHSDTGGPIDPLLLVDCVGPGRLFAYLSGFSLKNPDKPTGAPILRLRGKTRVTLAGVRGLYAPGMIQAVGTEAEGNIALMLRDCEITGLWSDQINGPNPLVMLHTGSYRDDVQVGLYGCQYGDYLFSEDGYWRLCRGT